MNQTTTLQPMQEETPETVAAIKVEIEQCFREMDQIQERMEMRQHNIDRLRDQTRSRLEAMRKMKTDLAKSSLTTESCG